MARYPPDFLSFPTFLMLHKGILWCAGRYTGNGHYPRFLFRHAGENRHPGEPSCAALDPGFRRGDGDMAVIHA